MQPLTGFTVGVTGHRRASEQADMLTKRGATVLQGPVIESVPLDDIEATIAATRAVIDEPVDVLVLTTGVGTRSWMGVAELAGIDDDLRDAVRGALVLARGPKARSAAIGAGFEVSWQAPGETGRELVAHLEQLGVRGRRVAVQRDGGTEAQRSLGAMIAALGADVVEVPVYKWRLPDDLQPAHRLVAALTAGRLDAVTFTSAIAADHLFELAPDEDAVAAALSGPAIAVAVGPITADALRRHGVTDVVEPVRPRLGAMVQALVAVLAERASLLTYDGVAVRRQGCAMSIDGSVSTLTAREVDVLEVLMRRAPAVVTKAELVEPGADEHGAEMAVTRLRTKLGPLGDGIITIPRRGYRCVLDVAAAPPLTTTAQ